MDQAKSSSKVGNGWEPSRVLASAYKVEPISPEALLSKLSEHKLPLIGPLIRLLGLKPQAKELHVTLLYLPVWYVKGVHECVYLRASSYEVPLDPDVVAVEVDGKVRDVMVEKRLRKLVPAPLLKRAPWLAKRLTAERRFFVFTDVEEVAVRRRADELYVTAGGREARERFEISDVKWRLKRIFDVRELKEPNLKVRIAHSKETSESVIRRLQRRIVTYPIAYKDILTDRFEITELALNYLPYYFVKAKAGRASFKGLYIEGASGEPAGQKIVRELEALTFTDL